MHVCVCTSSPSSSSFRFHNEYGDFHNSGLPIAVMGLFCCVYAYDTEILSTILDHGSKRPPFGTQLL